MLARHQYMSGSLVALTLLLSLPLEAATQEPVVKPAQTAGPGPGIRLAAPKGVRAVQQPDGRIMVAWSPVAGATAYQVVRSVPPDAAQPISPDPRDTTFLDANVTAGKTYYYLVAAMNEGTVGLKAGSAPVKALRSAGHTPPQPPSRVTAQFNAAQRTILVQWPSQSEMQYIVHRNSNSTGWVEMARPRQGLLQEDAQSMPPGARVVYRVATLNPFNEVSAPTISNEVVLPAASGSTDGSASSTGSGTPSSAATGASGTVSVTIGRALTLRPGGTASASGVIAGFTAAKWVSLSDGIATVDAGGTVSARSAGRAQIVALGQGSDGSVRMAVVEVTVNP